MNRDVLWDTNEQGQRCALLVRDGRVVMAPEVQLLAALTSDGVDLEDHARVVATLATHGLRFATLADYRREAARQGLVVTAVDEIVSN